MFHKSTKNNSLWQIGVQFLTDARMNPRMQGKVGSQEILYSSISALLGIYLASNRISFL